MKTVHMIIAIAVTFIVFGAAAMVCRSLANDIATVLERGDSDGE